MNLKFNLDESLFDDEFDFPEVENQEDINLIVDDDFEFDEHTTDVLPGPKEGAPSGVAATLISLINDEWEAIQGYNDAVETLRELLRDRHEADPLYEKAIAVLTEIASEENAHVGQLQEVLKHVSPNAEEISSGEKEAKSQMGFVGGVLPVQSWDQPSTNTAQEKVGCSDDVCTLTDVDDEM